MSTGYIHVYIYIYLIFNIYITLCTHIYVWITWNLHRRRVVVVVSYNHTVHMDRGSRPIWPTGPCSCGGQAYGPMWATHMVLYGCFYFVRFSNLALRAHHGKVFQNNYYFKQFSAKNVISQ